MGKKKIKRRRKKKEKGERRKMIRQANWCWLNMPSKVLFVTNVIVTCIAIRRLVGSVHDTSSWICVACDVFFSTTNSDADTTINLEM